MSEEKETRSKSNKSSSSKSKKKKKKSKKVKKVVETEPEPKVVDIDVGDESEDEQPESGIETVEAFPVESTESKKGFASYLTFTKAEMPLLGYTIAALIFFFASVGKKCPASPFESLGFRRRHLQGDINFDNIFSDSSLSGFGNGFGNGDDLIGNSFDQILGDVAGLFGLGCLNTGYYAYAICFSIFGMLFGAGVLGWMKFNASLADNRKGLAEYDEQDIENGRETFQGEKTVSEKTLDNHKRWIDLFLFGWATAGWVVFTFAANGLFSITGNGFFALWVMMLCSIWNLGVTTDSIKDQARKSDTWIHALSLGSLVTIIELSTYLNGFVIQYKEISGFGLFVAVSSFIFGLVVVIMSMVAPGKLDATIKMYSLGAFLVLWLIAASLTTFVGPFLSTGNGYFAAWGSVFAAAMAFSGVQGEL